MLFGGGRRSELETFCYHGMLKGLRLIRDQRVRQPLLQSLQPPVHPPMQNAVVRQLANMILVVHAESAHAY